MKRGLALVLACKSANRGSIIAGVTAHTVAFLGILVAVMKHVLHGRIQMAIHTQHALRMFIISLCMTSTKTVFAPTRR